MRVMIFSGLPGSGKSSFLARAASCDEKAPHDYVICEADNFFTKDGPYTFDPKKLGEAHASCMRSYLNFLVRGVPFAPDIVAVCNTATSLWEISPYVSVAQAMDIPFEIVRLECSVETALARNSHGVPEKTIRDMEKRLKNLSIPPYWPSRTVVTD